MMNNCDGVLLHKLKKFQNILSVHKNSRGIYELDVVNPPNIKNHGKYLSNLSLFQQHKEYVKESEVEKSNDDLERPVTPINESILSAPKSYNELCRHVQRRIKPRPFWSHISIDDQHSVGAVLLGEVNAVWSGFQRQVDDPFLTPQHNKELKRRITVHIVSVCEQLFLYFCDQLKVLNARKVFSEDANLSRIRGQVATTAGKYLNLISVRRHIVDDLRKAERDGVQSSKPSYMTSKTPKIPKRLSFHSLIDTTRPRKNVSIYNMAQEIKDMRRNMPTLDVTGALFLLYHQQERTFDIDESKDTARTEEPKEKESESFQCTRKSRKWLSEPTLAVSTVFDDKLHEDLSGEMAAFSKRDLVKTDSSKNYVRVKKRTHSDSGINLQESLSTSNTVLPSTQPNEDLINLLNKQKKKQTSIDEVIAEEDSTIPSLIQVITRRQAQNVKVEKLKREGIELDERQRLRDEEERKPLPRPTIPQPSFQQIEIPGYNNPVARTNITIRSSDVHVPDKVELPVISLKMYEPLYNDLTGDISPNTVKELDANLFQDVELNEVYSEIMKTVSDDHLLLDNDNLIIKPVESLKNFKKILSSSTLTLPKGKRLINPELKQARLSPPWDGEPQELWERNGKPTSPATTLPRSAHPSEMVLHSENHNQALRAQASWMAWWKSTINTDDYFKYLSTKETDFLSVIYHFYNNDDPEFELDREKMLALLEEKRKREKFAEEVKAKKEQFSQGFWNVNVVKLGGLGKYPELTEEALKEYLECVSDEENKAYETKQTRKQLKQDYYDVTSQTLQTDDAPVKTSLQSRFEAVWRKLRMSPSQKVNAAAKYSVDKYIVILDEVVSSWEEITNWIQKREKLLCDLEVFELEASDPHRYFIKGAKGSSIQRLQEAKLRAKFYKKLESIEKYLFPLLEKIRLAYDDIVTLEGRSYHEKMSVDKVEMLYWLQQERRAVQLDRLGEPRQLKQFISDNHVTYINHESQSGLHLPVSTEGLRLNHVTT